MFISSYVNNRLRLMFIWCWWWQPTIRRRTTSDNIEVNNKKYIEHFSYLITKYDIFWIQHIFDTKPNYLSRFLPIDTILNRNFTIKYEKKMSIRQYAFPCRRSSMPSWCRLFLRQNSLRGDKTFCKLVFQSFLFFFYEIATLWNCVNTANVENRNCINISKSFKLAETKLYFTIIINLRRS